MIRVTKQRFISASLLFAIAALAGRAQAQGSRKDDIVFNAQGRPMAGAIVRVCTSAATGQPCTPLAQVYSDAALTQALANPLSADGLGNYNFYAAPGRYMIELSGPGITTKQIPNVILPSDPSSPTFTSVTTTSGISAFSLSLTGNLTVNGSTAVAGSLTVGGAPVPAANQDNQWTAGQRFKGSIPWRDITAYMPAGGCSSVIAQVDPPTTGTISSGSPTLTLANARDFKNGCGIAVLNAGPTSTIGASNQGCTISAIARSSNTVTVTCAAAHNIPVGSAPSGTPQGIQIAGVTDSSFNGTFVVASVADTTHFTYAQTAANASSSAGTASMQFGYAHGVTGSTTYNYKVAAVDGNGGMSAASPAITITTGNATLTTENYNWINFGVATTVVANIPHEWVIYGDKGLGGAYSCVGTAFLNAYADFGLNMPCPAFAPATPPVAAGPQTLNAIISAGGGTTTLTLNTTASNTATTQNVYHDESSFLLACVNDEKTSQAQSFVVGEYGCYVPAGHYPMNGPMPTDVVDSTPSGGISIKVAGTLRFNIMPWFFSNGTYFVHGEGASGGSASFMHFPTTTMYVAPSVAAAVVIRGGGIASPDVIEFSGFSMFNLSGHGIVVEQLPFGGAPAAYRFDDDRITEIDSVAGGGSPLVFYNGVLGVWMNHDVLTARHDGLHSIQISNMAWNGGVATALFFNNLSTVFKGIKIDAPGGNGSGGGPAGIYINGWIQESLTATEKAAIVHDSSSANTPGDLSAFPINGISIHNFQNSDPATGPNNYTMFEELGPSANINTVDMNAVGSFGGFLSCGTNTTVCNDRPSGNYTALGVTGVIGGTWGGGFSWGNSVMEAGMPILSSLPYSLFGASPQRPAWAMLFPPPNFFQVTSTGAGGLSAGTYCMKIVGKDAQTTPGLTLPTNELCQTVGASSVINLSWQQAGGFLNQAYPGFRLYYGPSAGNEANFLDLPSGGNPYTYAFTSTAGNTGGTPPTASTAYLSWLGWNGGCIYCTSTAAAANWALGVGEPNPAAGVKLDVKGGTIRGQGGVQAGTDTAFNASPRGAYNAFLPNLTSAAASYQRMTLDKAVTVTRFQLVLGTAGAGCTTQSTVSVTDGTSSVTLTTANGTAIYDSGAVSQNFAAAANLDIKIATAASGCTTAPQNANVTAQYRMQ
jgi:hypothetical protein